VNTSTTALLKQVNFSPCPFPHIFPINPLLDLPPFYCSTCRTLMFTLPFLPGRGRIIPKEVFAPLFQWSPRSYSSPFHCPKATSFPSPLRPPPLEVDNIPSLFFPPPLLLEDSLFRFSLGCLLKPWLFSLVFPLTTIFSPFFQFLSDFLDDSHRFPFQILHVHVCVFSAPLTSLQDPSLPPECPSFVLIGWVMLAVEFPFPLNTSFLFFPPLPFTSFLPDSAVLSPPLEIFLENSTVLSSNFFRCMPQN